MKKIPNFIGQDDFCRRSLQAGFFFWGGILLLLAIFWKQLPPQVPLFYSLPWGEEQLVAPLFLILIPLSILLIGGLNFLGATFFYEEKLLLRTLSLTTALCAFLGIFTLIKILMVTI